MKTITKNANNHSSYIFEDTDAVTQEANRTTCEHFIIGDLNSSNSTLYENVTDVPGDWSGNKYFYDGTTWTEDPNWVDPDSLPEPPIE